MIASLREQLVEEFVTALGTSPPAGVPTATRARLEPYKLADLPAMSVRFLKEKVEYEKEGKRSYYRKRFLIVRISHFVASLDSNLDPLAQWATACLDGKQFSASGLPPFLNEDVLEDALEWEYVAEDESYFALHQDFLVPYHTIAGDATRAQ